MTSQREDFEKAFPTPSHLCICNEKYSISPTLVGDVTYAVHNADIQQAKWEAWQAATKNQADELDRLKLDIAEALGAVTNQDALIEATIKLCAQKCTNIATSNGNSDCTKIAADWCGRVILSLVPEDAQRELNEN